MLTSKVPLRVLKPNACPELKPLTLMLYTCGGIVRVCPRTFWLAQPHLGRGMTDIEEMR
jgi:hypothetical protein